MATVQANLLSLALRIDPVDKTTGVEFVAGGIGANDGVRFAKQRLLDVYNEARLALFNALRSVYPLTELSKYVGRTLVTKTDLAFSAGITTNFPVGFIQALSLRDYVGAQIFIVRPTLGATIANANANSTSKHFKESATNRFVTYEDGNLRSESGASFVTNRADYQLKYYGIVPWTLADVINVTPPLAVETFDEDLKPKLLEIAERISMELGLNEVNALALSLVGKDGSTSGD